MKIRKAESGDIGVLIGLFGQLYRLEDKWTKEKLLKDLDKKNYFVLEIDNEIVGVISLEIQIDICQIEAIIVKPEWHKKGIGKNLINYAQEFTKKEGCHKLWCWSLEVYNAKGFFIKMGFEQEGLLHKHWFGQDCYVFGKQV